MIYAPPECIDEINNTLQHKVTQFVIDGSFHRFGTNKNYCWAVGQSWQFKGDDYCIVKYGDWRDFGNSYEWKSWGDKKTTKHFDKQINIAIEKLIETRKEEKRLKHVECREKWEPIYKGALQDPIHSYMLKKQIDDNYLGRNHYNNLIIPLFNHNHFVGAQIISTNKKTYSTGIEKKGAFSIVKQIDNPDIIYFTEGYATACSVYMATKKLVVACMDCGGIYRVVKSFREKYRDIPFMLCADNDQFTNGNPGVNKALDVASKISDVKVIYPEFKNIETKPTDFNDLHCLEGLEIVINQVASDKLIEKNENDKFTKLINMGFSEVVETQNGDKVIRFPIPLRNFFYHKTKYVNCKETKQTFIYNNGKYESCNDIEIECFAQKYYYPELQSNHQAKEFLNTIKRSNINNIEWLRRKTSNKLICFNNGVLNYQTMEFTEHDHKHHFFNQIPYDYNEEAICPWWDELLMNLTMEREYMVDTIEEYLGYILSGMDYHYNKVLIFRGSGANGKSSLINSMKMVIGEENCSFAQVSGMAGRFVSYDLRHKLANFSEEDPPKKVFNDTSALKLLTGMSSMRVEQKGQAATSITNYAKLVMAYNELPYLTDFSEGMRRRLLIIPFEIDLIRNPNRKIKDLYSKIDKERSGIANKAITGLCRLLKQDDFTVVPETKDEINEIIKGSDTVREWWAECILVTNNEDDRVSIRELFENYKKMMDVYCKITFIRFGKKVNDIVLDVYRTKKNVVKGTMKLPNSFENKASKCVSGVKIDQSW